MSEANEFEKLMLDLVNQKRSTAVVDHVTADAA